MSNASQTRLFSPGRTVIIATSTFTQLVRMKVFYFLLAFILLVIGVHFFEELPHTSGPESLGAEKLRMIKSTLIGSMKLFAIILGIVATALLIPKDLEDRTLYTILAKPVPRLDYLLGKLFGVLALIFVGLLLMTILLCVVLQYQTNNVLELRTFLAERSGWPAEAIAIERAEILGHGVTWSLAGAICGVFFEAAIIAAVALLVSTFSSSTLFTVVTTTLIYFIGQFMADGRDYWLSQADKTDSTLTRVASQVVSVIFPDFRLFRVVDGVIAGELLTLVIFLKLAGITALYVGIYTVLSWFVFSDKEI